MRRFSRNLSFIQRRAFVKVFSDEPVSKPAAYEHVEHFPLFFSTPGPGGIPPRGLLGDGPNDPRGGTLLSVTGEVIDPK